MEIGHRLKTARVEMGLTQEQVAEEVGVSRQTVYNWENGKCYPDIVNVIKLSDLYSVSLDELLKEDKNMIRHLKEATDTVTSRKKLTKLIITLVYWGFWVLAAMICWIVGAVIIKLNLAGHQYSELEDYVIDMVLGWHFISLVIAVIMGFVGASEIFDRRRWLYVPITGVMFVLYRILTYEFLEYIAELVLWPKFTGEKLPFNPLTPFIYYFTRGEWITMLFIGLVSSAAGMFIGTFIRHAVYYRNSQKEKEAE